MEHIIHYICVGGCRGESSDAKVCGAESCSKHGQPLTPCTCEDGLHQAAFNITE